MSQLSPFLKFNDGKAKEAMNFYKDCLGGELEFMTVKGSPMESEFPADKHDLIMHSTLKKDGWMLIGSDMMQDKATVGDNAGVSVSFTDEAEIKHAFAKLSERGQVFMPVEVAFWGDWFGIVTDKFGIEWMLNCPAKKD